IVVQHSPMANQTHSFRIALSGSSYERSAPGTNNIEAFRSSCVFGEVMGIHRFVVQALLSTGLLTFGSVATSLSERQTQATDLAWSITNPIPFIARGHD